LNSMDESNFSKVCACNEPVKLNDVKKGIRDFARDFQGYLFVYTMFLNGVNDTVENVTELKDFIIEIRPHSFSIGEYTEGGFGPISREFKNYIKESFNDMPFEISFNF
jgi:wyosine [tRNA(Phe)-imidazoG37] synthetase (radical SAM superfamily)